MIESEKREGEITNKVEKEKPRKKTKKARIFLDFSEVFPFPLYWSSLPPFFQIRSSLSYLVLLFPLYYSPLSCMIFSPCRPGPILGTWCGMVLERFYHHSLSPHPVKCSSGLKICADGVGSRVIRATIIWTEAIPYNYWTGVERGHSLKFTLKYFRNYFEPILNLFWINVISYRVIIFVFYSNHICIILW